MTANVRTRGSVPAPRTAGALQGPKPEAPGLPPSARATGDVADLLARSDAQARSRLTMGMQASLGNASVQRLVVQAQAAHTPAPAKPKAKPKLRVVPKPKAPPPPSFSLFGAKFQVVGGNVRPAGKHATARGWAFTPQGPQAFDAVRTMSGGAWRPAGGAASSVLEKTTIQVSGSTATPGPIIAEPQGTTLAIVLDAHEHASTTSLTVGPNQADALDVPAGALTGLNAGDALKLTAGGRSRVYVFSKLVPDTGPAVLGLFFIGAESKLQGGVGVEGADVAPFASTFNALAASTKISAAEIADQDVFDFLAEVEGGFGTVQTADTGVLSFGFAQWTAVSDLPPMLSRVPKASFDRYLGKYGLGLATPVLGTPHSVQLFFPGTGKQHRRAFSKMSPRNASERCLTLGGVEMVTKQLRDTAATEAVTLAALGADATTAKAAWVAATTAALKKTAGKKITKLWNQLAGLATVPATVPKALSSHPDRMADRLIAAATTGQTQASAVGAGTQSLEAIRTNEWALRFQMAGKDEDVQAAEVHQTHDSFMGTLSATTSGIPNSRLLQSQRAHAVLFSSWINAGGRALAGVGQAVTKFHDDQVADPKLKPDWDKFPWPAADAKWSTAFDPVADDFESVAEDKLLAFTFDPVRRKKLLNKHFPP